MLVEFIFDITRVTLLALHVRAAVRRIARAQRAGSVPLADLHATFFIGIQCASAHVSLLVRVPSLAQVPFRTDALTQKQKAPRFRAGLLS
jgi:hypothetical protein